jgi:hypothetical protein
MTCPAPPLEGSNAWGFALGTPSNSGMQRGFSSFTLSFTSIALT